MEKNRLEDSLSEDEDPSGTRGMARADFILRKKGYPKIVGKKRTIQEIMKYTPKVIGAFPDADKKIKEYLKEFREEGYGVVKNYRTMDSTERWNYFLSFLRENDYFNQA
jgi:hypothetical protein